MNHEQPSQQNGHEQESGVLKSPDNAIGEVRAVVEQDAVEQSAATGQVTEAEESATGLFPIVGIGASAGGLAAFEAFFANMPLDVDGGMAFVLVQHLDPHHRSLLTELIGQYTRMQVYEVEDGMSVERGCAYVIPPNKDMALLHGRLHLMDPAASRGLRLPIDFLFRSLAQDRAERAICIVLSGSGTDGTLGLKAIKEAGGLAIVQTPESAAFDGMPRSAIATQLVDFILPPEEMPAQLVAYVRQAFRHRPRPSGAAQPKISNWLQKIFVLLRSQTGHDFSHYKQGTIQRCVERRIAVKQVETIERYVQYLGRNPTEVEALFREFLIGVTNFFRDPRAFLALQEQVVPHLFAGKLPGDSVRVWVSGCSTGEEAYSIAILLQEYAEGLEGDFHIQIFATDIDSDAIDKARTGKYPANIAADVSPERLKRFFTHNEDDSYRIKKTTRDLLVFAEQDVLQDPPFSKMDLISCRNLLIYMEPDLQKAVLPLFYYALNAGGFLFLGSAETPGDLTSVFATVDREWKLYQRKPGDSAAMMLADLPLPPLLLEAGALSRPNAEERVEKAMSVRELTEQELLKEYAPACVMVNERGEILYVYGRTGKYLELAAGEVSVNILRIAREGLRLELAIALRKAVIRKETVRYQGLQIETDSGPQLVNMTVRLAPSLSSKPNLVLVIFEDVTTRTKDESQAKALETAESDEPLTDKDARIEALEQKLSAKDEYLRTTIEELESANEELQSTNEELQSTNEEAQSTNEELKTSKEELQSINEELVTVNAELQKMVEELSRTNNDMNNLLAGTGIGTIFVDHQLRIQRFTPAVIDIIHLIQTDIGRPVSHFASKLLHYDQLVEDIEGVLRNLIPRQSEVQTAERRWYLMRILPYRTLENLIEGAVITFVEITAQKRLQETLLESEERYRQIFEGVNDVVIVIDLQDRIVDCNRVTLERYGYSREELLALNLTDITVPDEHAHMKDMRERVVRGDVVLLESAHRTQAGGSIAVEINACRVDYQEAPALLMVVRDISGRKDKERHNQHLATLVRDSNDAIIVQDFEGRILAWNPAAERAYGWSEAEALKMNIRNIVPEDKREEAMRIIKQLAAGDTLETIQTQRISQNGRTVDVWITATALVGEGQRPYAITTTEREVSSHGVSPKREAQSGERATKRKA